MLDFLKCISDVRTKVSDKNRTRISDTIHSELTIIVRPLDTHFIIQPI